MRPGSIDSEMESDVPVLKGCLQEVCKELGINGGVCPVKDELIHEFCRWGGGEMHSIASVMGGIASQEGYTYSRYTYGRYVWGR